MPANSLMNLWAIIATSLVFGLAGCSASQALPQPPSRFDPTVLAAIERNLQSFWVTQVPGGHVITVIYPASNALGFPIMGDNWCIRSRLEDLSVVYSGPWQRETPSELPGESEAIRFFGWPGVVVQGDDLATSGPLGIEGNQLKGYGIVRPKGASLNTVLMIPSRGINLHYFDGERLIASDFMEHSDFISETLISEAAGPVRKLPAPPTARTILTNGREIIYLTDNGAVTTNLNGVELWRNADLKRPPKRSIPTRNFYVETDIGATYFAWEDATGITIREFATGKIRAAITTGVIQGVYSLGKVIAVTCSPTLNSNVGFDDRPRTLHVFVDGVLAHSQDVATGNKPVVLRDGQFPLVGWTGYLYDLSAKQSHSITGTPVCCVGNFVISVKNSRRLYVTKL